MYEERSFQLKKIGIIVGILIALIAVYGVYVFVNKLYYPPFPVSGISAKEAINIVQESDSEIAKIAVEGDTTWYLIRRENRGIDDIEEKIKQMVAFNGWEYREKEGSALFFYRNEERLIATAKMWSKNYVIIKLPSNFK